MKAEQWTATMDELDDLLDAERAALLKGDLDEVARLFENKSGLIDTLSQLEAAENLDRDRLREKLARNQDLLASAAEGVRSVARRLATIRRVRDSLDTYDAHGQRNSVDVQRPGTLEKRA